MSYKPLISIIVPVFKVEQYLDKCVLSIVNQTYDNLEIILIDDGGTDLCPSMCDDWKHKDPRIIVIHKENEGQGIARNTALDIAKGEYVLFVDSDDYIDTCMVEKMVAGTNNGAHDLVLCGMILDNGLTLRNDVWYTQNQELDNDKLILEYISRPRKILSGPMCKMFRKKAISEIRFPNFRAMEDAFIMPLFLGSCKSAYIICDYLYYYLIRSSSTEHKPFNDETLRLLDCTQSLRNYISEKYPHYLHIVAQRKVMAGFELIWRIHMEGRQRELNKTIIYLNELLLTEVNYLETNFPNSEFLPVAKKYLKHPLPFHIKWFGQKNIKKTKKVIKKILMAIKH